MFDVNIAGQKILYTGQEMWTGDGIGGGCFGFVAPLLCQSRLVQRATGLFCGAWLSKTFCFLFKIFIGSMCFSFNTGDFSCTDDRHLLPARTPKEYHPDVVIMEVRFDLVPTAKCNTSS